MLVDWDRLVGDRLVDLVVVVPDGTFVLWSSELVLDLVG